MLIEIEGPSGAGKTSLIARLRTVPQFAGRSVPDVGEIEAATGDLGWRVGAFMRGYDQPIDPTEAVFLYCARTAARARLALTANDSPAVVLCDRLLLSLQVQARLAGISSPTAEQLADLAVRGIRPDLTILLDVNYPIHCRRLAGRGQPAQPEITFHRTREIFAECYEQHPGPKLQIDTTSLAPDEVLARVSERLPHAKAVT